VGRKSGEWRTTPVNLLTHDGTQYLVSAARRDAQWVRNLRVAGNGELRVGRRTQTFDAAEVADIDKGRDPARLSPPVESRSRRLLRWRERQIIDEEIRRIAPDHPVFRIASKPATS
jgi:deazaflavin-dependent oxidoreductase (nitroreductase family)